MPDDPMNPALHEAREACWRYLCGSGSSGSVLLYNAVSALSRYIYFRGTKWGV
jgi:hypothetical protein